MQVSTESTTAGAASRRMVSGLRLQVTEGTLDPTLLDAWDELAVATRAVPWARPGWMVPWWRRMGRGSPLVFSLRSPGGEVSAVLPMQRTRAGVYSPTNWHTPAYAVVARDETTAEEILRRVFNRCGSRLTLDFVPPALADMVEGVARSCGGRSHRRVLEYAPYVALQEGWAAHVDKHLIAELSRRSRRLAERGAVEFEVCDGSDRLATLLDEGLRVEASGWKGRAGTAILSSSETHEFYRSVAQWAAGEGLLRLAFLRVEQSAVAFDFGVEHDGVHYLLKTGYDETLRSLAPGKQLRLRMLEACTARGLQSYELLGDALSWKADWTPLRREFCQVHAFPRGPAGAREWMVHAKALPVARTARDSLRGVRRLAFSASGSSGGPV